MSLLTLWPILTAASGLFFTLFASGPALANLTQISLYGYKQLDKDQLYVDKDGTATAESQQTFPSGRLQTTVLSISSLAGASLALSSAICEDSSRSNKYDCIEALEWLNFAALVSIYFFVLK
jgi:hypothetical protein